MNTENGLLGFLKHHTIIYPILREPARIIIGIPKAIRIASEDSYFPEKKRKGYARRLMDNFIWLAMHREPNDFYGLYGFDLVEGVKQKEYCDYLRFMITRDKTNKSKKPGSQIVLLRDKFLFYKYMASNKLPVPEVFAFFRNGKLYDNKLNLQSEEFIKNETNYFIKEVDGECASFVMHIKNYEDFQTKKIVIEKHNCIFQRAVVQTADMNAINPNAINTLRIVTVNKEGNPRVLSALLRVGTSMSKNVDNWAKGGLAIGVKSNGYLQDFGFYKPAYGGKVNVHPDTKVKFSEFRVPQWEAAIQIACEAHKTFYNLRSIGWDIAITDSGPIFIEGNDNWEISLMQACDRGLKKEWEEVVSD